MWWAIGITIWGALFAVVLSLCKAAGDADRKMEGLRHKKKEVEQHDRVA